MTDTWNDDEYNFDINLPPTFDEALAELQSDEESLPGDAVIYGLSGLSSAELDRLQPVWEALNPAYRQILMQTLVDVSESNFELNYQRIGRANLHAPQPEVRQAAIEMLWEDMSVSLLRELLTMLRDDPSADVRAEAAQALGRYVYGGEMGDINDETATTVQDALLERINDTGEAAVVRRRAVESIGNCTRQGVPEIIADAYRHGDAAMRQSAMLAMGRTCDSKRWESIVLDEIDSDDEQMRYEAINAAGELQLSKAVPAIVQQLNAADPDDEDDRRLQLAAIWALGEIGGDKALNALYSILDAAEEFDDAELEQHIDDAINVANLMSDPMLMMDFSDVEFPDDE